MSLHSGKLSSPNFNSENVMPMLPSGRQVAITLAPLADMIAHVADGDNLKKILAVENPEGLYPYTEVNFLQMPECFGDTGLQTPFVQDSLPRPENMVTRLLSAFISNRILRSCRYSQIPPTIEH